MDKYATIGSVGANADGVPVKLALQERLDVPPEPFHTLSWRTRYAGTTRNRRFYWYRGSFWTAPLKLVRDLLTAAEQAGMLESKYDDRYARFGGGAPGFVDSSDLSRDQR